jgi:2-haloacid dehalogenase
MDDQRWATFDCYGTLVDWNAGIAAELARLVGSAEVGRLLRRYHAIEPVVQREHQAWS